MKVTSVQLYPLAGHQHIVALADIILDGGFAVADLRVARRKSGGYCVLYPISQYSTASSIRHTCNPINSKTQQMIEAAVLEEFNRMASVE